MNRQLSLSYATNCYRWKLECEGFSLEEVESETEEDIDMQGYPGLSKDVPKGYADIRIKYKVKSEEENTDMLKRPAEYSPVYNTLIHGTNEDIEIERK